MSKNSNSYEDSSCNVNNNNGSSNENPLVSCLFMLPPKQFSLLSSILGILLIDNLNLNQQNALGNFIVNIGQSMLTAAAQGQSLQSNNSQNGTNDDISKELQKLKKQISSLKKELDRKK